MKEFVKLYRWWYKNLQQMCFDDGLGLKSIIYGVFMVSPYFKGFH